MVYRRHRRLGFVARDLRLQWRYEFVSVIWLELNIWSWNQSEHEIDGIT